MADILLLASSSLSRQQLLKEIQICFQVIPQLANETHCDWSRTLPEVVRDIAAYKMAHAQIPEGAEGEHCFVLTADTLSLDKNGTLQGKPESRADAIAKIKQSRGGSWVGTAFCLDKKIYKQGKWIVDQRIERYVQAYYEFEVPDHWLERYLDHSLGLQASGAIAIEGYGLQFLKCIEGSFTTIVGLPLFEVRIALEEIGFKF
jgi:nucleoside triphosphate pyrophosphatase